MTPHPSTNKDEDRKLRPIIHRKQGNDEDPRAKSVGQDPRISTEFQTRKQVGLPTNYYKVEVRNISVPRIQDKSRKRLGKRGNRCKMMVIDNMLVIS